MRWRRLYVPDSDHCQHDSAWSAERTDLLESEHLLCCWTLLDALPGQVDKRLWTLRQGSH